MTEPFVTTLAADVPVLVITAGAVVIVMPAGQGAVLLDLDVPPEHFLLRLTEQEVREEIRTVIETDGTLTRLAPEMVGDADIHAACRAVALSTDLGEERGTARFRAALAAPSTRRSAASAVLPDPCPPSCPLSSPAATPGLCLLGEPPCRSPTS